jgi:hypothetical protein
MPYKHTFFFKSSTERHNAMMAWHQTIKFPLERCLIGDDHVATPGQHKFEFETPHELTERELAIIKASKPLRVATNQQCREGWNRNWGT